MKVLVHLRFQRELYHLLRNPVGHRRHAQYALPSCFLRYGNSFHGGRKIAPRWHPVPQLVQIVLQALAKAFQRLLVNTGCSCVCFDPLIGLHHQLFRNGERCCLFQNLLLLTVGFKSRPSNATPSLHGQYSRFLTTTGCSVPVPCIGTLILKISVFCVSPLASRRLVPAVPYKSLHQTHATYTPDTTCSVTELPAD